MAYNNPIPLPRVLEVLELVDSAPAAPLLDVGCGSGEVLAALSARGHVGHGLDLDAVSIEEAVARQLPGVSFAVADVNNGLPTGFDGALCLGSTHAFGPGEAALVGACEAMSEAVVSGGWVLLGEGYQRQPLPAPYLELLGTPHGLERTHGANVAQIEACGLEVVHSITANQADWDAFEWGHQRRQRAKARMLPEPQRGDALSRLATWQEGYLRWGRATMGFGLYLARVS